MRTIIKKLIYQPVGVFLKYYLKKDRIAKTPAGNLLIKTGVFHPLFCFSSLFLWKYISSLNLKKHTFLELGAGSGMLSFYAAKQGAIVTATDISQIAIDGLIHNKKQLNAQLTIMLSNLFLNIPPQTFNYILINPPYYPKTPQTESQHAWYCGANFEYFTALFAQLPAFINYNSVVLMSLSEDCNVPQICKIAKQHQFQLVLVKEKRIFWERNFIYQIKHLFLNGAT